MDENQRPSKRRKATEDQNKFGTPSKSGFCQRPLHSQARKQLSFDGKSMANDKEEDVYDTSCSEDEGQILIKVGPNGEGSLPVTKDELSSMMENITSTIAGFKIDFLYDAAEGLLHYKSCQIGAEILGAAAAEAL